MQQKFENGELQNELSALQKAGIYNPSATDITKRWNADKLLTYGRSFDTDALNTEVEELWKQADEYNGKPINWAPLDSQQAKSKQWQGVEPEQQQEYDD